MKKLAIVGGVLVLILLAVFFVMSFVVPQTTLSQTEQKKAIETILGRKVRTISPTMSAKDYAASDFSLTLPPGATEYTFEQAEIEKSPGYLSGVRFQAELPKYLFVIRVEKANGANYDDIPAVRLRRSQKDAYKEANITVAGKPGIVFEKDAEDAEKTAFVLTAGKAYSFAISGQQLSELQPVFIQVMSSVQIK